MKKVIILVILLACVFIFGGCQNEHAQHSEGLIKPIIIEETKIEEIKIKEAVLKEQFITENWD